MLGKLLTAVNEPELMLVALHPVMPEAIRTVSCLNGQCSTATKGFLLMVIQNSNTYQW